MVNSSRSLGHCQLLYQATGIVLLPVYGIYLLFAGQFGIKAWKVASLLFLTSLAVYFSLEKWIKPLLEIDDNYVPVGQLYYQALVERPLFTILEWGKKLLKTFVYAGFFGAPLLPFIWGNLRKQGALKPLGLVALTAANITLIFYLVKIDKVFPFGGNVLYNFGLGPELLADVYTLGLPNTPQLPAWAMLAVHFFSQLSASFLVLFIVKSFRSLDGCNRQFATLLVVVNAVYLPLLSITSFFDRYLLLPLASLFFVLVMLLKDTPLKFPSQKWALFFLMGTFSMLATKDYLAWKRAKRQAFDFLSSQGVGIKEMDAGYEYNGFYNYHKNRVEIEGRSFWWVDDDTWMITFGPVPGYKAIKAFPYYRWLFLQDDAILVLKKE